MNAPTHESRTDDSTESTKGAAPTNSAEEVNRQKAVGSTLSWVIALFGTGVGAGILFLPLNAGAFGFWPLIFATVFIFPDLNTGNTTYKAVQRSADLVSIGPMLQGMRKPVNDLSRGALVDDIVYTIALTAIQATQ